MSIAVQADTIQGSLNILKDEKGEMRAKSYRILYLEGDAMSDAEKERFSKEKYQQIQPILSFPSSKAGTHLAMQFRGEKEAESSIVTLKLEETKEGETLLYLYYWDWL